MRVALLSFVVALVAVSSADALAQIDDQPLPGDATAGVEEVSYRRYSGLWWGDIGFTSGDATPEATSGVEVPHTTATAGTLRAGVRYVLPSAPVGFEAQLGLVLFFLSPEEQEVESTLRLANPMIGAFWAPRLGRFDLRAGVGLTLPLASVRTSGELGADGLVDVLAYTYAQAIDGAWDAWAWLPDHIALLLPSAAIDGCVSRHLCIGGAFGLHLLFSTADEEPGVTSDTGPDAIVQLGGDVAYRSRSTRTGIWLKMVSKIGEDEDPSGEDDTTQLSLEPYLHFDLGDGFFRASLVINLDEPFGFAFSGDPLDVWGLHLGGGTRF
jgi:hypothetical protein